MISLGCTLKYWNSLITKFSKNWTSQFLWFWPQKIKNYDDLGGLQIPLTHSNLTKRKMKILWEKGFFYSKWQNYCLTSTFYDTILQSWYSCLKYIVWYSSLDWYREYFIVFVYFWQMELDQIIWIFYSYTLMTCSFTEKGRGLLYSSCD